MTDRITAEELDRKFDDGEDIGDHIDWSSARRPNRDPRRVNVDFPAWVVAALDAQAARLGITRQAVIKVWIAERLDAEAEASIRRAPSLPAAGTGRDAPAAAPGPERADDGQIPDPATLDPAA